jgi:acetyl/propionyl-CoA carboxylase alpha subunit
VADVLARATRARGAPHAWDVVVDDGAGGVRTWRAFGAVDPQGRAWVWIDGDTMVIEAPTQPSGHPARHVADTLSSPMPATVVSVLVSTGDHVAQGQTLVLLEAMKMEVPLRAPHAGIVSDVRCEPGALVQPGVPLVVLEEVPDARA